MEINEAITISDIAKELNIQSQLVRYHIKRMNIKSTSEFKGMKLYSKKKANVIKKEIKSKIKHVWKDFNGNEL